MAFIFGRGPALGPINPFPQASQPPPGSFVPAPVQPVFGQQPTTAIVWPYRVQTTRGPDAINFDSGWTTLSSAKGYMSTAFSLPLSYYPINSTITLFKYTGLQYNPVPTNVIERWRRTVPTWGISNTWVREI